MEQPQRDCFMLALPIFPCSHPQSIVGANELNFCVRDGNRWTLIAINTNYSEIHLRIPLSRVPPLKILQRTSFFMDKSFRFYLAFYHAQASLSRTFLIRSFSKQSLSSLL